MYIYASGHLLGEGDRFFHRLAARQGHPHPAIFRGRRLGEQADIAAQRKRFVDPGITNASALSRR